MPSYQGIDLTAEAGQSSTSISWHSPHPIFVIILVGPEEVPFGVQKDLLCAQSPYYRELFARDEIADQIEHIVKLPNTDIEVFGCFQNFIFTCKVYDKEGGKKVPGYQVLLGVWKLAVQLKMAPLRVAVMDAMAERRTQTATIPSAALLVQAWKETEEGSGLRLMLIGWAAEHMRTALEVRNTFARALPQEILSELVIVMADLPAAPAPAPVPNLNPNPPKHNNPLDDIPQYQGTNKRARVSAIGVDSVEDEIEVKPKVASVKKAPRKSTARRSNRFEINEAPNHERDMAFCADLITRMMSAPGFWTRLVAPFKKPVDPVADNVPNYFAVVKRPMCLQDIQAKMHASQYVTAKDFENDVRQIFQNCYEYWTQDDGIFKLCEQFEKHFNEKFAAKDKWRGQTIKTEVIDD